MKVELLVTLKVSRDVFYKKGTIFISPFPSEIEALVRSKRGDRIRVLEYDSIPSSVSKEENKEEKESEEIKKENKGKAPKENFEGNQKRKVKGKFFTKVV